MRGRAGMTKRRLATVLFIDMVGSTERAAELGDRRWQEVLARYHGVVRRALRAAGGREVDNAGDGFFAAFDAPAEALACACALTDELRAEGIEIRSGLHMGEFETVAGKPSGIGVHIGARVGARAGAGQVLVSGTLRDVLSGSDYGFEDLGVHPLKGVPGEWRVYRVTWQPTTVAGGAVPRRRAGALAAIAASVLAAAAVVGWVALHAWFAGPAGPTITTVASAGLYRPTALALDPQGRIDVLAGGRIWRLDAGGSPTPIGTSADLSNPQGIAVDPSGRIYVADTGNDRIVAVDPAGSVSTLAPRLQLSKPSGVAIGFGGQVLIADTGNNRIVAVAPDGTVSIVAGSGEEGYAGDGGPALTADLSHPTCLAVDANDDLFVADVGNDRVRRISVDWTITTAAGTGDQGFSGDGGPADEATLRLANGPLSSGGCLAVDGAGDLFIADALNNRIREVTVAGVIRTVAGNGRSGFSGDGGAATGAELSVPLGVASDLAGHLYIADSDTNRVRRVS